MPTPNNLSLLFISLSISLLLSFHFAQPDGSPSPSPAPEPDSSSGSPSPSPSPIADGPTTISIAPSPIADGPIAGRPNSLSDGPSPSLEADGPAADYDASSDQEPTRRSEPILSPSPDADLAQFDVDQTLTPSSAASANPRVKEICDSTEHPDLCLATILPRLDGDNPNVPAVLEISIRRSADLAKIGLTMAKTMANNSSIPREEVSILNDCRDSYDYAVYNFESTLDALPGRDVDTMRSMLNAVVTDVGDCEDGLSRYGEESPFANVAEKLVNMTSNCLAIVSLLN